MTSWALNDSTLAYISICVHFSLNPDRPGDLKEMFDFRPNETENKVRINKCLTLQQHDVHEFFYATKTYLSKIVLLL